MVENMVNKIKVQKLYTQEIKEVNFYFEYDPFYIANEVSVKIENDRKYTITFNFREEDYYIESCNPEFWNNEDLLIEYTIEVIINSETQRINKIKNSVR